jgi:zinc transporter
MDILASSIYNYYLLDGTGGFSSLSKEELPKQDLAKGLIWLDMDYADTSVQNWLSSQSGLNDVVYEALTANDSRPRLVHLGDGLLVILRGINLNPGAEPDDMISIRLWITEKMILSTHMNKLYSIEDVKNILDQKKAQKIQLNFWSR